MSDQVKGTIELLQAQIQRQEQEIAEKKRVINSLCPLAGFAPIYAEIESTSNGSIGIRSDEFYGRPLAEVVRKILEKRKSANLGAASVQEIFEAMKSGGYSFEAKNDDYAKRGLYQSLTKNSKTFHKIPSTGKYGLLDWYPNAKPVKGKEAGEAATTDDEKEVDAAVAEADVDAADDIGDGEAVATAGAAESPKKPR